MAELKTLLQPISACIATLDAADPAAAERALNERFPPGSEELRAIRDAAFAAVARGELCTKGGPEVRYSRIARPEETVGNASIDAVLMDSAAGPAHTHDRGEFCLCFPDCGAPTFEDRTDTWIVLPPGSRHVPAVKGGRMLVLYWLPGGAVTWG